MQIAAKCVNIKFVWVCVCMCAPCVFGRIKQQIQQVPSITISSCTFQSAFSNFRTYNAVALFSSWPLALLVTNIRNCVRIGWLSSGITVSWHKHLSGDAFTFVCIYVCTYLLSTYGSNLVVASLLLCLAFVDKCMYVCLLLDRIIFYVV